MTSIKEKTLLDAMRLLIGVSRLEEVYREYKCSLSPTNVYYTKDGVVQIQERDIWLEEEKETFLNSYKWIIGYAFLKTYEYEDIACGDMMLMQKDIRCKAIGDCQKVEDMVALLYQWCDREEKRLAKMVSVPTKTYKRYQRIGLVNLVFVILLSSWSVYQQVVVHKKKDMMLQANSFFIDHKYMDTITTLQGEAIEALHTEAKYMLAVAYIKSSNLKNEARENALAQVHLHGDERYLLFWNYLGRRDFSNVYEIVDRIADERLLHYAYSVELESLQTNDTLSLKEKEKRKQELIKELETYIEEIREEGESL